MTSLHWLLLCVAVPTLSFGLTAYAPVLSHAFATQTEPLRVRIYPEPHATPVPVAPAVTNPDPAGDLPPGSSNLINPSAPLTIQMFRYRGVPIAAVEGGVAGSWRSPHRQGVEQFVAEARATAGLNGTFFANASLDGTDNLLIGPSITGQEKHIVLSPFDKRPALDGRPMVLMARGRTVIVPYKIGVTDNPSVLRSYLPSMTDAFLGGAWLVRGGVADSPAVLASYRVLDANDPRRRAFFGIMNDGRPMLGATTYVATSLQLARALVKMGVHDAVLLDSGFSTSLVFQNKILVSGHTAPGIPSRPVPHALVLYGTPDASSIRLAQNMIPSIAGQDYPAVLRRAREERRPRRLS